MTIGSVHYGIKDLQRMCKEREEESLTLEFKPCNELKVGTTFRDKAGIQGTRGREDVLFELTRDVTACLNSAGGTIIYGIQEKKSRAYEMDGAHTFKPDSQQDDVRPERVIQWLRAHIQPTPTVDVYRVFEDPNDPQSPWYLVVEVPQGQQAYMAKDYRFYKRVGATVQPMEQYEVVDVMNRTRAAALDLQIQLHQFSPPDKTWGELRLDIAITSTNFVASEYGALKLTLAYPLKLSATAALVFPGSQFKPSIGLFLGGEDVPHASAITVRWGAHSGNVIFPGDWYNFYGNGFSIDVPKLSVIPNSTYLFHTELFTMNSMSKKALYAIRRQASSESFELCSVTALDFDNFVAAFWETYHAARERLKS
jgi:hypothetical protein